MTCQNCRKPRDMEVPGEQVHCALGLLFDNKYFKNGTCLCGNASVLFSKVKKLVLLLWQCANNYDSLSIKIFKQWLLTSFKFKFIFFIVTYSLFNQITWLCQHSRHEDVKQQELSWNNHRKTLTFLALVALRSGCSAMLEKGTSMEYLMLWSSCTTTLETFLKESLRLWAAPRADRTCSVLNNSGWKRPAKGQGEGDRLVTRRG